VLFIVNWKFQNNFIPNTQTKEAVHHGNSVWGTNRFMLELIAVHLIVRQWYHLSSSFIKNNKGQNQNDEIGFSKASSTGIYRKRKKQSINYK